MGNLTLSKVIKYMYLNTKYYIAGFAKHFVIEVLLVRVAIRTDVSNSCSQTGDSKFKI